jgi:hypothetical protein
MAQKSEMMCLGWLDFWALCVIAYRVSTVALPHLEGMLRSLRSPATAHTNNAEAAAAAAAASSD